MNNTGSTVLICPLNWGLGHASRVIPLIYAFKSSGYKVIIGGTGKSGTLLKNMFSDLPFLHLPCFEIRYPFTGRWFFLNIILQLPLLIYSAIRDHRSLNRLARIYSLDIVVSDNRYGLYSRWTRNIIITHQISPVLPDIMKWAEYPLYRMLRYLINRFDECWIPDFSGETNLSGNLSHRYRLPENARYIGILSRFSLVESASQDNKYDMVIVLSGPQPELGALTRKMIEQAQETDLKILIICGLQNIHNFSKETGNLKVVSHLEPDKFRNALENALVVICTAGYSSIMDLVEINKPAILIPTDGQSEQEYLAAYLNSLGLFICVAKSQINLKQKNAYANLLQQCKLLKKDRLPLTDLPILRQTQLP